MYACQRPAGHAGDMDGTIRVRKIILHYAKEMGGWRHRYVPS